MDLKVLRSFVEIAREQSFTAAAEKLSVTQPTLSRQIADLEEELGQKLFERTTRSLELTEKGHFLFRRAQDILALVDRTKLEAMTTEGLAGDIRISAAETPAVGIVAEAVQRFQEKYPRVRCHFVSADALTAAEHLRSGLSQFGVFNMPCRLDGFEYIRLPRENRWGVLTRRDGILAGKTFVTPEDLKRLPLYVSKQRGVENRIGGWLNYSFSKLRVVGTYNLLYNASLVVRAGGNALCLDGIVPPDDDIVFLPFQPSSSPLSGSSDLQSCCSLSDTLFLHHSTGLKFENVACATLKSFVTAPTAPSPPCWRPVPTPSRSSSRPHPRRR